MVASFVKKISSFFKIFFMWIHEKEKKKLRYDQKKKKLRFHLFGSKVN